MNKITLEGALKRSVTKAAHGNALLATLEAAEQTAHRNGFHVTAHALNRAKNALGWEIAGEVERAGEAARGQHPAR